MRLAVYSLHDSGFWGPYPPEIEVSASPVVRSGGAGPDDYNTGPRRTRVCAGAPLRGLHVPGLRRRGLGFFGALRGDSGHARRLRGAVLLGPLHAVCRQDARVQAAAEEVAAVAELVQGAEGPPGEAGVAPPLSPVDEVPAWLQEEPVREKTFAARATLWSARFLAEQSSPS